MRRLFVNLVVKFPLQIPQGSKSPYQGDYEEKDGDCSKSIHIEAKKATKGNAVSGRQKVANSDDDGYCYEVIDRLL